MASTFTAQNAQSYQAVMGRWSERLAVKLLRFLPHPPAGAVLDLGCGTGSMTSALLGHTGVNRITGVDYAEVYVEAAKRRFAGEPRVRVSQGDATSLRLADHEFDLACSLLVLNFVSDPHQALLEMRRVVRPGGTVCGAVWDLAGGVALNRMFWDTASAVLPEAGALRAKNFSMPLTRPGELGRAWRDAGFEEVVEQDLVIRMEFADFDDYWKPFEGGDGMTGKFVADLEPEKRERFKSALRAAFEAGRCDGARSFVATANACRGRVPG